MAYVLVTRPQPAADALVERLKGEGINALAAPVSAYADLPFDPPDFSGIDALAFTSAAAVAALKQGAKIPPLPAFCVGDATAEAARAAGFSDVRSAAGDAAALVELIAADGGVKTALHVSGLHIAQDMAPRLAEKGVELRRVFVYTAQLLDELPSEAVAALETGKVPAVLLFSMRSAARFSSLVSEEAARNTIALCLSPRVAAGAAGAPWKEIRSAAAPDLESLLESLHRM